MDNELASALVLAARLTLAAVFLTSGISKLRAPAIFAEQIGQYEILPRVVTRPFAGFLMVAEIVVAIGLTVGWRLPLWVGAAALLLGTFAGAITITLRRGKRIPCGCFGDDAELVRPRSLARIGLLLGVVAGAAFLWGTQPSLDRWVHGRDLILVGSLVAFALMAGRLVLLVPDALVAMGYRRRQA